MTKHHVMISGTGRTGTTFLLQLLTKLGLDTGFDESAPIAANCNAGLELDIRSPSAPYIIKNPHLCDYLDEVIESGIVIDHAIVPVRDLYSAAQSRRAVKKRTDPSDYPGIIPGGLWGTDNPTQQESVLLGKFYTLLYAIANKNIPLTLLHFPRLVEDSGYLYGKLPFLLRNIPYDLFDQAFTATARPELVHKF